MFDINFTCPSFVLINQQVICYLTVVSNNVNFSIEIDFADGDVRQLKVKDDTVSLLKTYSENDVYNISVKILENSFEYFLIVNGNYFSTKIFFLSYIII